MSETGDSSLGDDQSADPEIAELAQAIEELRSDLATITERDVPLLKGTVRRMLGIDFESIHELPPAGQQFADRLDDLEDRVATLEQRVDALGSIDAGQTTKEQKFAAVLAYAQNKASGREGKVSLSAQEVKGCAGVSRRYAYDLIEAMGDEVSGACVRDGQRVETGSGTERKNKALLVDCEVVHERPGTVNELTTLQGDNREE